MPTHSPASVRTRRTPKNWRTPFIDALREHGNVRLACQAAGVPRQTAYDHRTSDAAFKAQWDAAVEEACDILEDVARQRAVEMSDTLLIFLLKAHRPEKYRETVRKEHAGAIEHKIVLEYAENWRGNMNAANGRESIERLASQ